MQNTFSSAFSGIFSRLTAFLLTLVSFFTVAKPNHVILTVRSASPEAVVVEFKNGTGKVISPEQRFLLEEKTENGWTPLPFAEDCAWNDIAEICLPTQTGTRTVNALSCFGAPLAPGSYRFTLYYICEAAAGVGGGETRSAAVEFMITG